MRLCTLKGLLVVLLIQHCTSEGVPTPIQSSTEVTYQDDQTLSQEPESPAAEMVPVMSPPTLKDVQQAVQEASEQVEGRGAEEVLKELLERVVEAALGQAEGRSEANDAAVVQEAAEKDPLGNQTGGNEAGAEIEMLKQPVTDGNMSLGEDDNGFEENGGVAATGDIAEGDKGVVEVSLKSTDDVETGIREAGVLEVIDDSSENKLSQEDMEGVLKETKEMSEAEKKDDKEQLEPVEGDAAEKETQDEEETPATVEVTVAGQPELEIVEESEPSLGAADEDQIGHHWKKDKALVEETQIEDVETETTESPSDKHKIKTKPVVGEPAEKREEAKTGEDEHEKGEHGYLEEGGTEGEVEAEGADLGGATGDERYEDDAIKEQSTALVEEGGDKKAGEKEQTALEDSDDTEKEDQENLVISGPQPGDGAEASVEESPENQAPTPNPSLGEEDTGENALGLEKPNHSSKIINTTHKLLPHDRAMVQPTLDYFENLAVAEHPQAEEEEMGEANELVEDAPGTREINDQGLEPWKIGATLAAVFLVLETVVIIIYILKFRKKKSTPAPQRTCEDGCVEPEAATGGDCSDDTLPAGNGDAQQIAALDPSEVASTLSAKKEQLEDERATAMSVHPPTTTGEATDAGPGPDSSQTFRTSI